jgi:hypothetical protein
MEFFPTGFISRSARILTLGQRDFSVEAPVRCRRQSPLSPGPRLGEQGGYSENLMLKQDLTVPLRRSKESLRALARGALKIHV